MILGGINFKDLFIPLNGKTYASLTTARDASAPVIAYGQFINLIINFLIIAVVVFILVKAVNKIYKKPPPTPKEPPAEVKLLTEIRDLLKEQSGR